MPHLVPWAPNQIICASQIPKDPPDLPLSLLSQGFRSRFQGAFVRNRLSAIRQSFNFSLTCSTSSSKFPFFYANRDMQSHSRGLAPYHFISRSQTYLSPGLAETRSYLSLKSSLWLSSQISSQVAPWLSVIGPPVKEIDASPTRTTPLLSLSFSS